MKAIAGFGAFVRDTWPFWAVLFSGGVCLLLWVIAPATVTLDAVHWKCTMAIPEGIGSRCIEYVAKERVK